MDIPMNVSPDSKDERKSFRCPQCKYVTDRKNNLKRHIITMHQESSKCLECCGVIFKSKASLRDHVCLFHRGGYCCQICGRNFCRKALLHRHLTVHSGQKDFSCHLCGYATSHKSNLERHQKVHFRCREDLMSSPDEASTISNQVGEVMTREFPSPRSQKSKGSERNPRCYLLLPKRLSETHGKSTNVPENDFSENEFKISTIKARTREDEKQQGASKNRIWRNFYNCSDCNQSFAHQRELIAHECVPIVQYQPSLPIITAVQKGTIKQMPLNANLSQNTKDDDQISHSSVTKCCDSSLIDSPDSNVTAVKKNNNSVDNSCIPEVTVAKTKTALLPDSPLVKETRKRPLNDNNYPLCSKYRCLDKSFELEEFSRAKGFTSPVMNQPCFSSDIMSYFDCNKALSNMGDSSAFCKVRSEAIPNPFNVKSFGNMSPEYGTFIRNKPPCLPSVVKDDSYKPPEKKLGIWRVW